MFINKTNIKYNKNYRLLKRHSQAGSTPDAGLDLLTLRSRPEWNRLSPPGTPLSNDLSKHLHVMPSAGPLVGRRTLQGPWWRSRSTFCPPQPCCGLWPAWPAGSCLQVCVMLGVHRGPSALVLGWTRGLHPGVSGSCSLESVVGKLWLVAQEGPRSPCTHRGH